MLFQCRDHEYLVRRRHCGVGIAVENQLAPAQSVTVVIGESNAISHSSVGKTFDEAVNENNGATAQSNTIMNADTALRSFCFITSGLTVTGKRSQ